jgi:hypothetical protein
MLSGVKNVTQVGQDNHVVRWKNVTQAGSGETVIGRSGEPCHKGGPEKMRSQETHRWAQRNPHKFFH